MDINNQQEKELDQTQGQISDQAIASGTGDQVKSANESSKSMLAKKPMMKKLLVGVAIAAVAIVAFNVFTGLNATNRPVIAVSSAVAKEQVVSGEYSILGTLSPAKSSSIASKVSGRVNEVLVLKGDLVKAGDLLIQLDDTDVQLQNGSGGMASDNVQKYKMSYDLANEVYLKNKNLYDNGAIAQLTYEQSRVAMEQAKIQYQTAAAALSEQVQKTSITAPINGVVVAITVQEGDSVSQGTQLISIVDMDQVILKGTVPESIIGFINHGQDVAVKVESLYGQVFNGKVSFISPVSVPAGQIFPVEISISNVKGPLKAGMTATATVKAEMAAPVLAVPTGAVFERDGRKYVYVIAKNQVVMTEVAIGMQNSQFTAINSGIAAGDQIVSSETALLMNGDQVKF